MNVRYTLTTNTVSRKIHRIFPVADLFSLCTWETRRLAHSLRNQLSAPRRSLCTILYISFRHGHGDQDCYRLTGLSKLAQMHIFSVTTS